MKTSELSGPMLDRAVAQSHGQPVHWNKDDQALYCGHGGGDIAFAPSKDWSQGGPIVEQANITLMWRPMFEPDHRWWATVSDDPGSDEALGAFGPTPLVAAMRAYVASELGDEINLPDGLQ
jgi:hypothetical protein